MSHTLTPGDRYTPALGTLPAAWEIAPLKYTTCINALKLDESTPPETEIEYIDISSVDSDGRILKSEPMRFENAPSRARRLPRNGDTLVSTVRTYLRAIAHVPTVTPGLVCSTGFAVVSPGDNLDPSFLFYWLRSVPMVEEICARSVGVGYPAINPSDFSGLPVPLPPLPTQRAIADFLDRKTRAIDELIRKKERLIELLQEKRQALITQAVTKGLDPNVPMKDSGVPWLGEIPAHWHVKRLKYAAKLESGHTPSRSVPEHWRDDNEIPWVSLNDTKQLAVNDYISDTVFHINELGLANSSARLLPERAVVFTRDATIEETAITTRPMAVSQHLIAWLCRPGLLPEYLLRVFAVMRSELERLTMGATLKTIGMPDVRSLVTPMPPIAEQQAIAEAVQIDLAALRSISDSIHRQLDLLREYRQALISAAVTGQIDVTDEAAA